MFLQYPPILSPFVLSVSVRRPPMYYIYYYIYIIIYNILYIIIYNILEYEDAENRENQEISQKVKILNSNKSRKIAVRLPNK